MSYNPPYSSDLNPIEKKWVQAKAIRGKRYSSIDAFDMYLAIGKYIEQLYVKNKHPLKIQ